MQKYYIVYDGRAAYDEDDASILEAIGETDRASAVEQFNDNWGDADAVLFEYDTWKNALANGQIVPTS